jgi:hypothetical protein
VCGEFTLKADGPVLRCASCGATQQP